MTTTLSLDNIVNVHTTVQATNPGTAAFDVTMILDVDNTLNTLPGTTPIVPQIRTYGSLAEMSADGFKPYQFAYRTAQAIFGQKSRPATIKVTGYNVALNIQDFLTAVEAADPAFYGILPATAVNDSGSATIATNIAQWCDTLATGKHCLFFDSERAIDATTSVNLFSTLKGSETSRAAGFWHLGINGSYALKISQAFVDSNVVNCKINGVAISPVTYSTTSNALLAALADAFVALDDVADAVVLNAGAGTDDDRVIVLFAANPNQPLILSDFVVSGGSAQATATFSLSEYTTKNLVFSADLVASNTVDVSINGNAATQTVYATDNNTTVAHVATHLGELEGVGNATVIPTAGAHDNTIRMVSLAENARLDVTNAVVASGSSQATISVDVVQTIPDYQASASCVGECIAAAPGTKAWSNRLLTLVGADALSTSSYNAILANNANVYAAFSQQKKATRIGTTANGLTIRNRILVDALDMAIQNDVFEALQRAELTPYTDAGIQAIVSVVNGAGQAFVTSGALASFTCSGPKRSAVSPADVTAGVLNNIIYTAVSAGEIQKVNITGTVIV